MYSLLFRCQAVFLSSCLHAMEANQLTRLDCVPHIYVSTQKEDGSLYGNKGNGCCYGDKGNGIIHDLYVVIVDVCCLMCLLLLYR